jgi:cyclic pyranopterin phosphate synthase
MMNTVVDAYGRSFKTLRVSLLNKCNFNCTYCTEGDGKIKETTASLSVEDLLQRIAHLHQHLQLDTVRLTGGEPTLYHQLIEVISGVKNIGIKNISITTNGFLLEKLAAPMKAAGLQNINVSLDAIDEDVFFAMSKRNNVQRIINGILAAQKAGLQVKMNAVIMKGINESQILPLVDFAFANSITIRFLEVMAMGHLHHQPQQYFYSQEALLQTIASKYSFTKIDRKSGATANYWQTNTGHTFGIIANESAPFCSDCNRLRLDSNGHIFGCLSSNQPIKINNWNNLQEVTKKLQEALLQKQSVKFTGSSLSMLQIGG